MKCKHNAGPPFVRPRLIAGVMLVCVGAASWANALNWSSYYSRLGVSLSIADYIWFSQRISLIPSLIVPLMMFYHGISHTGIYAKRNMYLYPSRGAYWLALCRDALAEALIGSTVITACSIFPGLGTTNPLPMINWSGVYSIFALMTGSPLQTNVSPVLVFIGYWMAACLQLMAYLLLFSILGCRFQLFIAFITVLLFNLAFNSPLRRSVWDWASLSYGCWRKPFDAVALLAGWLVLIAILYFLGHMAYRKADVL